MVMLPTSLLHRWRRDLFVRGLREGYVDAERVEEEIPPGMMSASERWLLYFSLSASEIELRDRQGRVLTPDEIVPEGRRQRAKPRRKPPSD
ncbi:MAG: hypothetical protein RL199_1880 [Pseudomonadota bacterium]|jgi:hypothetical protein